MTVYDHFRYKAELERRVFEHLAHEQERDQGTFLQAMVMAGGDEARAKVTYFELRFRQMAESGSFAPFMEEILAEKGEVCYLCRKAGGKRSGLPVKTAHTATWAHRECLEELRFEDGVAADALCPMSRILAEKGEVCYLCRKADDKSSGLPVKTAHTATWAHRECLQKLRIKDSRTAYALCPISEGTCPICFNPIFPAGMTIVYLGREITVCYGHVDVSEWHGFELCHVCGGPYSPWGRDRKRSSIVMLLQDKFFEYFAHKGCLDQLTSILKTSSLQNTIFLPEG